MRLIKDLKCAWYVIIGRPDLAAKLDSNDPVSTLDWSTTDHPFATSERAKKAAEYRRRQNYE